MWLPIVCADARLTYARVPDFVTENSRVHGDVKSTTTSITDAWAA